MNKPFWMKLMISCLVCMFLIEGILPTNVCLAAHEITPDEDSIYYGINVSQSFGETYIKDFGTDISQIYYEENGEKKLPEILEDGAVKLKAGVTYYYGTSVKLQSQEEKSNDRYESEKIEQRTENAGLSDQAAWYERIVSALLLLIGTFFYTVMCLVMKNGSFSVENIIFNNYGSGTSNYTVLDFFTDGAESTNTFIADGHIIDILNHFYNFFSAIAILAYLIIIVYMAIRIMLGSTAEKGSKFKELIWYWVEGVLILFLFPYVMKYSIKLNDAFVSFIYENKLATIEMPSSVDLGGEGGFSNIFEFVDRVKDELLNGNDFMSLMYRRAWEDGWLVYAICWFVMFFQMLRISCCIF